MLRTIPQSHKPLCGWVMAITLFLEGEEQRAQCKWAKKRPLPRTFSCPLEWKTLLRRRDQSTISYPAGGAGLKMLPGHWQYFISRRNPYAPEYESSNVAADVCGFEIGGWEHYGHRLAPAESIDTVRSPREAQHCWDSGRLPCPLRNTEKTFGHAGALVVARCQRLS